MILRMLAIWYGLFLQKCHNEKHRLKELKKGHLEIFSVTIINVMIRSFMQISGDVNPIHTDNAGVNIIISGGEVF